MMDMSKYMELEVAIKQNPATARLVRESFIKPFNIDTTKYSFHHILPVSMGGQNNRGNLVVMDKFQHQLFHKYFISPQIAGMQVGDIRPILVPMDYDMESRNFKIYEKVFEEMMTKEKIRQKIREIQKQHSR